MPAPEMKMWRDGGVVGWWVGHGGGFEMDR